MLARCFGKGEGFTTDFYKKIQRICLFCTALSCSCDRFDLCSGGHLVKEGLSLLTLSMWCLFYSQSMCSSPVLKVTQLYG